MSQMSNSTFGMESPKPAPKSKKKGKSKKGEPKDDSVEAAGDDEPAGDAED
jgi:hypothetical protein